MGQSAAETVREIEATRDRLEEDFRQLEDRMPRPAVWGKKLVGIAVSGGALGTVLMFGLKRARKGRAAKKAAAKPVGAVIQVLPDDLGKKVGDALEDGKWKGWAAGIGGAFVVLKLAELRQIRRLNKAILAR
jgi:hypothetical protein